MSILFPFIELPPISATSIENPVEQIVASQNLELSGQKIFGTPLVRLVSQERAGARRVFEIAAGETVELATSELVIDDLATDRLLTAQELTPIPIDSIDVVEVSADRQEYDTEAQIITAEGNVVMHFADAVLTSDRIEVSLVEQLAVAEGNVVLTRGEQILTGSRFEYYLVEDQGIIIGATGQIDTAALDRDLSNTLPEDRILPERSLSDRLALSQPITDVTAQSQIELALGSSRDYNILQEQPRPQQGKVNKLRFAAERLEFSGTNWQATDLRLTNDPFSPPELELRVDTAKFEQTAPLVNQLVTTKPRLVIDDSLSIPLFKNRLVFDNNPQNPGLFDIGFDGEERGGLFIERTWNIISRERTSWSITPQFYLQRAIAPELFGFSDADRGGFFDPATFGFQTRFNSVVSPRNSIRARASITGFDSDILDENLRARITGTRLLGNLNNPHSLNLEANFRERLFNGSLGFQTVRSSFGGILTSPNISLGKTGINLQYQASVQNINADTDRAEFLNSNQDRDCTNLTRYQGAVFLGKSFNLWQGQALSATKEGALRYSPYPVVPYLQLNTGISGVSSFYSNNDDQISVRGTVGIQGQLGNFSRKWFDYTGFNVTYGIGTNTGESPFLFDRDADPETLAVGINQQLYGPIRLGVQASWNLDSGEDISTDYILEYSRRTHNLTLRYNPVLELGSFSFRISSFSWRGNSQPLADNDIRPVIQGTDR